MTSNNILYGVCYNPTWTTWSPPYPNTGADAQFSDADFFNTSFQALWNIGTDSNGNPCRNDLGTIGTAFNLVRLYNWGPTRGWNGSVGTAHIDFLNYALENNLKIIVPISNYFISDDTYAWNGNNPDSSYSFASAPLDIQTALTEFLSSATDPNTKMLHAAVHSFSVANEIDLNRLVGQGSSGAVDPASRLARVIWWIVNLQNQIMTNNLGQVLFTSPISNADQGNPGTTPFSYWFQAFVNGVTSGVTPLPQGTATADGATTFQANWTGLSSQLANFASSYYNSVNIYQTGTGLTTTLSQYDSWVATKVSSTNWPGQQFDVPLMLTEIGVERNMPTNPANEEAQYVAVTQQIALAIQNYVNNTKSLLMGYCLYEFSDEAYLDKNFGLFTCGAVSYMEPTGPTQVSYGTWPSVDYPVDVLSPVTNSTGTSLISALSQIFGHKSLMSGGVTPFPGVLIVIQGAACLLNVVNNGDSTYAVALGTALEPTVTLQTYDLSGNPNPNNPQLPTLGNTNTFQTQSTNITILDPIPLPPISVSSMLLPFWYMNNLSTIYSEIMNQIQPGNYPNPYYINWANLPHQFQFLVNGQFSTYSLASLDGVLTGITFDYPNGSNPPVTQDVTVYGKIACCQIALSPNESFTYSNNSGSTGGTITLKGDSEYPFAVLTIQACFPGGLNPVGPLTYYYENQIIESNQTTPPSPINTNDAIHVVANNTQGIKVYCSAIVLSANQPGS